MTVHRDIAALLERSMSLERAGDVADALHQAQVALEQARRVGEPEVIAASLARVAHVHFRQGRYEAARTLTEDALAYAPPESRPCADALLLLGMCAAETDDPAAAEILYHRAIDLSRQLGHHRALLRALHNLSAGVYVPRGQFTLALGADQEALRLAKDHDMPEMVWAPLATMGWVYWVTGRPAEAAAVVEELISGATPGSLGEGFALCLRADLALDVDERDSARKLYQRSRSIAEAIGDPGLGVLVRLGLCRLERESSNAAVAAHWAEDALGLASRVRYRHLQGMAIIELGRASWQLNNWDVAEKRFRAARDDLLKVEAAFDVARASLFLAGLLSNRSRRGSTHRLCGEAKEVWLDAARRITQGGYGFLLERERAIAFPLIGASLGDDDSELADLSAGLLSHLEKVPPPPLHIVTLGRFEVRCGTRQVPSQAWRQRRAGELFRLLLISKGYSLLRDQVLEALWPEKPPGSTEALFHQATSALRRALEPDLPGKFPSRYLTVEGGQATLKLPSGSWLDLEVLKEHINGGEWEAALDVYGGELFPDDRYAEWVAAHRESLAERVVEVGLLAARDQLNAAGPHAALRLCRRVLDMDPWQEEAVLLGMRACAQIGQRVTALRLYRDLQRRLREDLEASPGEELQKLYRALLRE